MKIIWEGWPTEINKSFWILFGFLIISLLMTGCATTGEIKITETKDAIWFASFDNLYAFQGKFVTVYYADTKTAGLKFEEPLGPGWKTLGVKEGDIAMGMAELIFLKPEDWRKAWAIIKTKFSGRNVLIGILKLNSDGTYEKEITWLLIK